MKINLKDYAVRDAKGVLNVALTVAKFTTDLETYQVNTEAKLAGVASAIHEVFDAHKGVRMNADYIIGQTLALLGATLENHSELTEACKEYLKASAGEGGAFETVKGKGGGTIRVCDKVAPAPKA
jgi:hypothetical protein